MFGVQLQGWFPLGVDCRRGTKHFLFLYLVLCAERALAPHIKVNRETKNVSCHACNLRLMETSLYCSNPTKRGKCVIKRGKLPENHIIISVKESFSSGLDSCSGDVGTPITLSLQSNKLVCSMLQALFDDT